MRMIGKAVAKQVLKKKKSQLKIIETIENRTHSQPSIFFFSEKISQRNTYYVLEEKKDAL